MGRALIGVVVAAAAAGLLFAGVSTYDFAAHLDRQVHGIHCSLVPGLSASDTTGSSGCHAALMSPYSSVLRGSFWGGVPVALPGMAVFAYLAFLALAVLINRRWGDPRATAFLLLVTAVPLVTSIGMGYLAFAHVGSACRLCVGMYVASAAAFGGALSAWILARRSVGRRPAGEGDDEDHPVETKAPARPRLGLRALAVWAGVGLIHVVVPFVAYMLLVPDFDRYVGACGTLPRATAPSRVLLPLGPHRGGVEAVEVLDPLCPACRAFERRLHASGLDGRLDRRALLFPLDSSCNWMVREAIHPGACDLSEAVLCAGDEGTSVLEWAFEEQESLRREAAEDPEAPGRRARARFPDLAECIGSAEVRARLNRGLRWAVQNQLPVLSPQLYVDGVKLCDEDTDLGLEYMLGRLLERRPVPAPAASTHVHPGAAVAERRAP